MKGREGTWVQVYGTYIHIHMYVCIYVCTIYMLTTWVCYKRIDQLAPPNRFSFVQPACTTRTSEQRARREKKRGQGWELVKGWEACRRVVRHMSSLVVCFPIRRTTLSVTHSFVTYIAHADKSDAASSYEYT